MTSPLESTVEKHIDSTSRLVRQVDIALSLLIVVSIVLGGLFLAVIADHWLLKNGLSMLQRFGIFAILTAGAGLYVYWKIVPLFRYQINPVYTADLIEKDVASFKNSLINWLLLRQERTERPDVPNEKINDRMFDGIVKTAAANVQSVPAGHAVDLRKLIWSGTFFAILFIGLVAYAILSPKSVWGSMGRVLFPFGNIDHPQAAQFRNVQPGDATALQGETLTISAEVISQSDEQVYLVFSTDDGQAVNQRIPMSRPEEKIAFETVFPPGKQGTERGFNSGVDYWIAQGESRSKQYRIDVLPAASVEIVSLRYDFPDYTGLQPEILENGDDVKALEGTTVTVSVRSTLPLQQIDLVFDDNPVNRVAMRVTNEQKTEAKGTFALKMPFLHKTFSFRATDENGNASRRSGIYRIEVIPDQPPKVQWADTATHLNVDQIDLPINSAVQLPIQAEDPDFALRYLRFKTEISGKRIPDVVLITSSPSGPTEHKGQIKKTVNFSPEEKRLAVGDSVEVWAEAVDTKLPEANVSTTRKIKINIVNPRDQEEDEQQKDGNGEGEPQEDEKQEKGADNTDEKDPEKKEGEGNGEGGGPGDEENPDNEQKKQDGVGQSENGESNPNEGDNNEKEGSDGDDSQSGEPGDSNPNEEGNDPAAGKGGNQPDGENEATDDLAGTPGENKTADGGQQTAAEGDEQKGEGKGGDKTDGGQKQDGAEDGDGGEDATVNPDTQDADAMERIVDKMKQDGAFPGANPFLQNDGSPIRDNSLDPNSKNQTNKGNDPTNPKESNQPPKDGEKPADGGQQTAAESEPSQGQSGEMDSSSGNNEGTPPDSSPDKGDSGSRGNNDGGDKQQPGEGGEFGATDQQPPPNNQPQEANPDDVGSGQVGGADGGKGGSQATKPDDPNLAYANQVTDLVLEYLEDQLKDQPNKDLLDKLGWNKEQLQQFYDKWKKMSQESKQPQLREDGKNAWEEALKSIGLLRPAQSRATLQGSQTKAQENQRVTEGIRREAPASILKQFQNYNNNVGK